MTGHGVPDFHLLQPHTGIELMMTGLFGLFWQIVYSAWVGGGVILTPDGE